jgi:LPXTG-motif cell wall-anchored protein
MGLRRVALIVAGAAIALTGCRVDATTTVTVDEDGSGTVAVEVVLDEEAFGRVDDIDSQLRVDDLTATGWDVVGPEPTADGGRRIVATKPFSDPDQATSVLAEITGPGVVRDATVVRSKRFGRIEQSFEATLDLSGGIEAFGDDELTALLDDRPIGQDVTTLEEELGAPLRELTSLAVVADLPAGDVSSSGRPEITETEDRRVFRWEAALGDPATRLRAQTGETDWLVLGLAALAIGAGLLLLVLLLVRRRARRRATATAPTGG